MADKSNITIYMQGVRASNALSSIMLKLHEQEQQMQQKAQKNGGGGPSTSTAAALEATPAQDDAGDSQQNQQHLPPLLTGASLAEQGQAVTMFLSKQHPDLEPMLTSKEALMASVSMQVALKGFEPIPNVFSLKSW